jgi:hypothetical protein
MEPFTVINAWMRNYATVEFIGLWEQINNPNFKPSEFDRFRKEAGRHYFTLSPQKWIGATGAIGIVSKSGRYGGTYAHRDIALEFGTWLSAEFKFYLVREFERLKIEEHERLSLEWDLQRTLTKINYRIHTDAVREYIVPPVVTKAQAGAIYASEADMLNVALFGKTAAEWRKENPNAKGNVRDAATLEQLTVLSNLESANATLITEGIPRGERLIRLNKVAITQMKSLAKSNAADNLARIGK